MLNSHDAFAPPPVQPGPALPTSVLGIDIGGANLKLSDATGRSTAVAFPMWQQAEQLATTLDRCLNSLEAERQAAYEWLAITMTGEMADCFATRREGVATIVEQVCRIFSVDRVLVYAVDGAWLSPAAAMADPWRVAASNWHALASYLLHAHATPDDGVVAIVDIGSTTVDVIPVVNHQLATPATTDRQRLQLGQLVYTGMQRTPVAAIVQQLQVSGVPCPVVAENFATSDDAYVVAELAEEALLADALAEGPTDTGAEIATTSDGLTTSDGRPRTPQYAAARLARMIAEDVERLRPGDVLDMAQQIIDAQARQVARAIERNLPPAQRPAALLEPPKPRSLLVSGHGRPLMQRVQHYLRDDSLRIAYLEDRLHRAAARCGPAVAVAWLLTQHLAQHQAATTSEL